MTTIPDRTESIFAAAVALPATADRAALLDRECANDPSLRGRIEALLRAHDQAGHLLDRPVPAGLEQTSAFTPHEQSGAVIDGRYKLLEAIGEGGMGTVWVAEQTEPVRRKVALKLIKPGMDSKSVLARFEAERQALAVMDHPNIAKVLDGGLTDAGRPYFVMEYVKGVPITQYCDAARLSVPERLNLFVQVCQAVQHAHQKGIIHRDLKPSNILVAPYDDKPVPKVIDFGLAKAMHQSLTERTLHTAHETALGTPLYMSPEQAQLNNLDVDTRSDIYSLGVLLYELLTGTTPLEKQRFKAAAWDEIKRIIREEEPPRPSARISSTTTLPSLAAGRQIEPARLTKLVRGELDWIVMKSLEKDRARRYESANGFAADVQRYLAGEPVLAAPPSARYRMRKFARKHRVVLTTTAAIGLLLVAGVAVSTWQAVRATRAESASREEQSKAETARDEAAKAQEQSAVRAGQVSILLEQKEKLLAESKKLAAAAQAREAEANAMSDFFKELTLEARRSIKVGDQWRAKTVDEAVAIIDSEKVRALFAEHPLAEAGIREWLATSAWPLGNRFGNNFVFGLKKGEYTFQESITDTEGGLVQPPVTALYNPDTARRHLERALELRLVHLGPNDPKTLATMHQLGQTIAQVDSGKALQVLGELVARSGTILGADHDDTLRYKDSLATAYEVAEKPGDAVQLRKGIYTLTRTKWGRDSGQALDRSDNLAAAFEKAGRIEEALRQREESLRGRRTLAAGSTDIDLSVAYALQDVARLYDQMQDYTRAEPVWRDALRFVKENENVIVDVSSTEIGSVMVNVQGSLGRCLLYLGKPADAEPVLRQCLDIRENKEPDAWTTFHTKSLLGGAFLGQKKYADAEPLLLAGYKELKQREAKIPEQSKQYLPEAVDRLIELYIATDKPDAVTMWQSERSDYPAPAPAPEKQ